MCAKTMDEQMTDPLLARYSPSERRAILVHKYFLGIELGYDPGVGCAITSWESRVANCWRRERQIADCTLQLTEMEQHQRQLCQKAGEEIPFDTAARDWIRNHAADWRRRREEAAGPVA